LEDESGVLNVFMEYVPGGSVSSLLEEKLTFDETLARSITRQTLHGLSYLHRQEVVHGDIKASNILLDDNRVAKISDAGFTQAWGSSGTVYAMAPEKVFMSNQTAKQDVWSIGCLVVEMLTGRHIWGELRMAEIMFKVSQNKYSFTISTDLSACSFHHLLCQKSRAVSRLMHRISWGRRCKSIQSSGRPLLTSWNINGCRKADNGLVQTEFIYLKVPSTTSFFAGLEMIARSSMP
jgi:serine/threonine protein kinase